MDGQVGRAAVDPAATATKRSEWRTKAAPLLSLRPDSPASRVRLGGQRKRSLSDSSQEAVSNTLVIPSHAYKRLISKLCHFGTLLALSTSVCPGSNQAFFGEAQRPISAAFHRMRKLPIDPPRPTRAATADRLDKNPGNALKILLIV